ncbi:MAG: thioredoxin [Spirochaetaceae bacterium]|nr:thioredoxin [Spirochaetaceae bacterium]
MRVILGREKCVRRFFKQNKIQIIFIIFAVFFIAVGAFRGDAAALWRKASFICLECIGIA